MPYYIPVGPWRRDSSALDALSCRQSCCAAYGGLWRLMAAYGGLLPLMAAYGGLRRPVAVSTVALMLCRTRADGWWRRLWRLAAAYCGRRSSRADATTAAAWVRQDHGGTTAGDLRRFFGIRWTRWRDRYVHNHSYCRHPAAAAAGSSTTTTILMMMIENIIIIFIIIIIIIRCRYYSH